MSGHPSLPQETRERIADAIRRDPTPTQRAIAREFGVSVSTVYRVAADADLADAWEDRRERTEAATAARAADLAKRRTELQSGLLDDIAELRDRLFGDVVHLHVIKVDPTAEEVRETVLPAGPSDWRATMGAITAAAQQTANLARLDAETAGAGQASGMLEQFEESLRAARLARDAAAATEQDDAG
ncbi:helix-turn-helix domain-containing protein [Amycolatopsis sp. cmx-4-54]|uniref:helix-turn-helix domain-containing protein n=1 Tax=Amycolatopsis sp. cmx-4-54 TaxID=2790936 RepID=UPI003978BE05